MQKAFISVTMKKVHTGLYRETEAPVHTSFKDLFSISPEEKAAAEYIRVISEKFVIIPKIV